MMKKLFLLPLAAAFLVSCSHSSPKNEEQEVSPDSSATIMNDVESRHPEWVKNATIYEVNIRQYTPEGTIDAFRQHLPKLKELGVDILWLMPVQPIGVKERKGPLGSYYSIQDYTAVNPNFGTLKDFRALVEEAHDLGFKIVLDWVANHTSFDHVWTEEHPDFYTYNDDGKINVALDNTGFATDWTDVADLNYNNKELWSAMAAEMKWWVDEADIDGFRCDVAGFVPIEFWSYLSEQRATWDKELFMLAEWGEPTDMQNFNMNYGWDFHHLLGELASKEKGPSDIEKLRMQIDSNYTKDDIRMYFTTNHDENSWNKPVFDRYGKQHFQLFVLCATMDRGMPLIYGGQEVGLDHSLKFFDKDEIDWTKTEDHLNGWLYSQFYKRMMDIYHTTPALYNGNYGGDFQPLVANDENGIYAFKRVKDDSECVALFNFGDESIRLTQNEVGLSGLYTTFDGQNAIKWNAANASDLVLVPGNFLLFYR